MFLVFRRTCTHVCSAVLRSNKSRVINFLVIYLVSSAYSVAFDVVYPILFTVNFETTRNGESSSSKGRGRKGSSIQHPKAKRGSKGAWAVDDGKEKVHGKAGLAAHHGGMNQVSSSTAGPVPTSTYQQVHPPRHSSVDAAAAGGPHFKTSQSRPYPNATGPGSYRHPLANYQFDPGTARMAGGSPGPSHSSSPQYAPAYYPGYTLPGMVPPGFPHVLYSQGMNIYKRNSPANGDGNNGMNAKNRTGQDTNGSIEGSVENSGDSPRNRSRTKASEQVKPTFLKGSFCSFS